MKEFDGIGDQALKYDEFEKHVINEHKLIIHAFLQFFIETMFNFTLTKKHFIDNITVECDALTILLNLD